MNRLKFGRRQPWPIETVSPTFVWKGRGKLQETTVGLAGKYAEIRTDSLQNRNMYFL
jgi:hypothetical protein